ncbi:nodulation protein NodH [Thalassococcus sp. S3]|uniref:nodulation protein NodH n=1 Tax=Thalassococcus sp. S3 TaxID=2017482 RepID=UPI0010245115|nr:nodulation protein NodH [Thalassococcus sp. S3]QBF34074.1 nodulation protein NodH [Thalassococcus sp. S3]
MPDFDYFVVFAEMRTGSNFLETNLNAFVGLRCLGEAFNPHLMGYPGQEMILGVSQAERDHDPQRLLTRIKAEPGVLAGFRYFHDHDPRILDRMLDDPRCAKIILTRNPLDSYVSWKIAQATGQWKLTNVKARKAAKVSFDGDEFAEHVQTLRDFQVRLLNRLQVSGQTAFYVPYEDLQSVEVMNGLARWLGVDETLDALDKTLKRQNPAPVETKVENPEEMAAALARLDVFNISRTPNFEPRHGPAVPSYVAAARTPLIYLPVRGGPEAQVRAWLAALDQVDEGNLITKLNQKDLRQWKRRHVGHRSFTVLAHPVTRVHRAFCRRILSTGPGSYAQIRRTLRRRYKLPIPEKEPGPDWTLDAHRAAFTAFVMFLKANLAGQTAMRVDATWCTQSQALQGFGDFVAPDFVLREETLGTGLQIVAADVGCHIQPDLGASEEETPFTLDAVYTDEIEALVSDVYQRDYMMLGFGAWRQGG